MQSPNEAKFRGGNNMKRFLILSIAVIAMAAASAMAGESRSYGDGVTLDEAVAIDVLLENPNDYVGRKIRVDGVITAVCKKRGCWMQVTNPESGDGVRIKVEDGVIVFPYESMGREAQAEGIFEAIKLTPEQVEAQTAAAHDHQEGTTCDKDGPKATETGAGCDLPPIDQYVYLIRGTGAVIKG
jgi:hypothetical protein